MNFSDISYLILEVKNLTDARYFTAMGVDYLHFELDPREEGAITTEAFTGIIEWVEGPKILCSIDHMFTDEHIREIIEQDAVHGILSKHADLIDFCNRIKPLTSILKVGNGTAPLKEDQTINGILSETIVSTSIPNFVICNSPHDAHKKIKEGLRELALYAGDETQVGIKNFDDFDDLFYME
ncbi:hypothetical protein [Membranihabitans maritimus]|uniref:hypothetical protein n=1 Tax=Membranihabitans maritimus TaxID=2904244 RepID=UPI001F2DCB0E|nr:hypothetical protein [Membranihabitans maritimus]